ncbi:MAG: hypothetical protein ACYC2H_12450 [Thermoplasmatota archaeon]
MKPWLASLLVLVVVSGCADPKAVPPEPAPSPTTSSSPVDLAIGGAETSTDANGTVTAAPSPTLEIDASGPGGSWLVVHASFEEPSSSVSFSYEYSAVTSAEEDGLGAFFWPFSLTQEGDDGWEVGRANPFNNRLATFTAADQTWEGRGGQGSGSSEPFEGMLIAFAAETDWSLSIAIELDDAAFLPPTVLRGSNATFAHGSEATLGVPGNGPANELSFETPVPGTGWSHLEVLRYRLQPDGVSQVALELPTHAQEELGLQYGYYAVAGSASGGHLDYLGSLADTAGQASADVTYVRGDLSVDFAYVHLPIAAEDLPGLSGSTYSGSTWPFQPLPTPP